eukprot:6492695-Alexandrium_andersonii.AAC.1
MTWPQAHQKDPEIRQEASGMTWPQAHQKDPEIELSWSTTPSPGRRRSPEQNTSLPGSEKRSHQLSIPRGLRQPRTSLPEAKSGRQEAMQE